MSEEKWMDVYRKQTAAIERLEKQRDDLLVKLDSVEMCLHMADDCASEAGMQQDCPTRRHIKHGLDICAKARGRHD